MTPVLGIIASSTQQGRSTAVGSYDALATITLSATTSSLTFAGVPTGYRHLQIRGIALSTSNGASYRLRMNGDTSANYVAHFILGEGSGSPSGGAVTSSTNTFIGTSPESTTFPGTFICDILDYASDNKNKVTRSFGGGDMNGVGGYSVLYSGLWINTSPVISLTMFPGSGSFQQFSSFTLYGVK
jgi:hypothetical protein